MINESVQIEREGGVAILHLSRGVTNALNLELVLELGRAIEGVKRDADICGLVLTSATTSSSPSASISPSFLTFPQTASPTFIELSTACA